jgi:Gpi18-like mannosyltransferase
LLLNYESGDYRIHFGPWYDFIKSHGGFRALGYEFSNHTPPYLILLTLASYLPIQKLYAIKLISIVFDFALAIIAGSIVRIKYPRTLLPAIMYALVLLLPTVVLDSSLWAQWDSCYTFWLVAAVLCFLLGKDNAAVLLFAIGLSFKLQAVFLAPFFLFLFVKKEIPLKYILIFPLVYLIAISPAWIAGRPIGDLLLIYLKQKEYYNAVNLNAANVYQLAGDLAFVRINKIFILLGCISVPVFLLMWWRRSFASMLKELKPGRKIALIVALIPPVLMLLKPYLDGVLIKTLGGQSAYHGVFAKAPWIRDWLMGPGLDAIANFGLVMTAVVTVAVAYLAWSGRKKILEDRALSLESALLSTLLLPFLLPRMHERYFYPADILSIAYAFYRPRHFWVPIAVELISLLSYAPYLLGREIIPMPYLAVGMAMVLIFVLTDFVKRIT